MMDRRSLKSPVTLGVVLIVLVVVLAVVWIVGSFLGFFADKSKSNETVFWAFLATGIVLLAGILAGVIAYLTLTIKAVRLNQRQSNFIDAVTHELKSPIASLKLYLQTMSRREVDQQQRDDFHRIMLEDVERLDSLINHLLDVARVDRGGNSKSQERFRLDDLLRQCATTVCVRYRLPEETVSVQAPSLWVQSQLVQMEILFRNLIDNAVKYGGSPPLVLVNVESKGEDQLLVTITDNGAGIPPNQRRKVFRRFVRLGNELERSTPGTGLGLHLVRNITKSLGASIAVIDRGETEPDGVTGTKFEVKFKGIVAPSD
ncbi:sensor histidine kinase [Stieleria varia]|uniref:histidine kinase n=1 Tax=Stieleria varia TaxID=2528005 RepID=A0A5C6B8S2_9BACT|nr:HAMP domain-containing sensor histidine kinase [Stieleria varia]TWU08042.1 Alkaline phosphatase synthesis sensor protein PhoR [Stieleria varia]